MFETVTCCGAGRFVSRGPWIHPDRIITSNEVIFVTDGMVFLNENGVEYQLEKNDSLILAPHCRHFGYRESENTSFFWAHWNGGPDIPADRKHQKGRPSCDLSVLFKQLTHYHTRQNFGEGEDYLLRLILMELLLPTPHSICSQPVSEAAAWIKANVDTPLHATDVAAHLGYNADYLNRLFKAHYRQTLKEFIDEEKLKQIKKLLLTTSQTLSEIATEVGFDEYKYFLKFFKYHDGITPKQFREIYSYGSVNVK